MLRWLQYAIAEPQKMLKPDHKRLDATCQEWYSRMDFQQTFLCYQSLPPAGRASVVQQRALSFYGLRNLVPGARRTRIVGSSNIEETESTRWTALEHLGKHACPRDSEFWSQEAGWKWEVRWWWTQAYKPGSCQVTSDFGATVADRQIRKRLELRAPTCMIWLSSRPEHRASCFGVDCKERLL
jgi:hypothetical protein